MRYYCFTICPIVTPHTQISANAAAFYIVNNAIDLQDSNLLAIPDYVEETQSHETLTNEDPSKSYECTRKMFHLFPVTEIMY